jgi:hypothetical protein
VPGQQLVEGETRAISDGGGKITGLESDIKILTESEWLFCFFAQLYWRWHSQLLVRPRNCTEVRTLHPYIPNTVQSQATVKLNWAITQPPYVNDLNLNFDGIGFVAL